MVSGSRRRPWCSAHRDFDYESFLDVLSARIVGIKGSANGLIRSQCTLWSDIFVVLFATDDLQRYVGRVDIPPKRIGIFLQDDIAHVVDQVIFGDCDPRRGGAGSLHPYLSLHLSETLMSRTCLARENRNGRGRRALHDEDGRLGLRLGSNGGGVGLLDRAVRMLMRDWKGSERRSGLGGGVEVRNDRSS